MSPSISVATTTERRICLRPCFGWLRFHLRDYFTRRGSKAEQEVRYPGGKFESCVGVLGVRSGEGSEHESKLDAGEGRQVARRCR